MTDLTPLTLEGQLFDGFSLAPQSARLLLEGTRARLTLAEDELEFAVTELSVSPRVFETPRFVSLPNGWELVCAQQLGLERLTARSTSEGPVAWLERRTGVAVAAVLATMAGVALFYFYGLPRLTEAVTARISRERERSLGEKALAAFDTGRTKLTDLDAQTVEDVKHGFDALAHGLPPGVSARLEFRDAPAVGANAFALPGGVVVITDQMVETCTIDESIVVLAHELGHVEHRHPLKHVFQQFGLSALGALFGGDASSLSLSMSTLPFVLARAHYSQSFELEADAEGFALAKNAGYSPELFASCLTKLAKKAGRHDTPGWSYVSSHPPDAERIARAHRAAEGFVPKRSEAPRE